MNRAIFTGRTLKKKRLAIFMHGGISGGIFSQGFPKIVQLVEGLSGQFDVSVYSLAPVEKGSNPSGYKVYAPPAVLKVQLFRWVYLVATFLAHHFRHPRHLLFSFWAYPVGFLVVVLGKLLKRPSFVSILGAETANLPEINYGYLRKPGTRRRVLWTCQHADQLIAVSQYQIDILKQYGLTREARVIPFGADRKLFYPLFKKPELPLKILHVANLNIVKDQATLVKAFQVIHNRLPSKLRIVGPDFFNGKVHHIVKQLGLEGDVEILPGVSQKHLPAHYHWADAFMLTSLSEGQNNAITEAMMSGLLPISTAVGSMVDLGEKVGIVAAPKDYNALGNKVVSLYRQAEEWEKRRRAAFAYANAYDQDWTLAQLKSLLSEQDKA